MTRPQAESEDATCARLCMVCLRGVALMGRDPVECVRLAAVLPVLGEWVHETYGQRVLRREARA